jgi:YD repeat-containing protein
MNGKQIADVPMASGKYVGVEVSPDGRQAVLESSPRIGISELWMADVERGVATRLSYDPGENTSARLSPDGTRVAYTTTPLGGFPKIVVVDVAGGVTESFLADDPVFKLVAVGRRMVAR